jgi:hypothetical protein
LEVQSQQLAVQIHMESDRVISAFRSGVHEKIIDNVRFIYAPSHVIEIWHLDAETTLERDGKAFLSLSGTPNNLPRGGREVSKHDSWCSACTSSFVRNMNKWTNATNPTS